MPKTISQLFDLAPNKFHKNAMGVEVECEWYKIPQVMEKDAWLFEVDSSLKSAGSFECILKEPRPLETVLKHVDKLRESILIGGGQIMKTPRSSVHVHLNMRNKTFREVVNFYCFYLVAEEVLTEWAGEERVGNLFCLRGRDAYGQIYAIQDCLLNQEFKPVLSPDHYKYAAFNMAPLKKFGSVEIRTLSTLPNLEKINEWLETLDHIREFSERNNCSELPENFSMDGPVNFLKKILGPHYYLMVKDQKDLEGKAYRGMRLAQDLIMFM